MCLCTGLPAVRLSWQRKRVWRPGQGSAVSGAEVAASPGNQSQPMEASPMPHFAPLNLVRKADSFLHLNTSCNVIFQALWIKNLCLPVTVDERCYRFSDCASCTANTNVCQWCDDKKCISAFSNCTSVSRPTGGTVALLLVFWPSWISHGDTLVAIVQWLFWIVIMS